ncbi:MAG: MFS transporter [Casimicrobiaceae bacterium]
MSSACGTIAGMTRSMLWRLVPALGITQIVSWGTLYYSIAVLGESMRAELGIAAPVLFGAYSLALLIAALVAPSTGRAIDHYGGRRVMAAGSVVAGVALLAIAHAHSTVALYAAWGVAGVAMALTMYDAAFATLSQHSGTSYRAALTALTLLGGLASTVFWPTALKGLEWVGWRDTMSFFALLQFVVCLPLHLAFVPRGVSAHGTGKTGAMAAEGTLPQHAWRAAFIALAAAFALNGFIATVLTVHLINILQRQGLALATAVWIGTLFGPMQVTGRILEFIFGRRFAPRKVGMLALATVVASVVVLLLLDGQVAIAILFTVLYGFSNGVVTIVRGTVPAELFGRAGYGRTLGLLAAPALFARALAPLAFAPLAATSTSALGWLLALLALSLLSLIGFAIAVRRR